MSFDLSTIGPWLAIILMGAFIFFMTQKRGWKWAPIITGGLMVGALSGQYPMLAMSLHNSIENLIRVFTG